MDIIEDGPHRKHENTEQCNFKGLGAKYFVK